LTKPFQIGIENHIKNDGQPILKLIVTEREKIKDLGKDGRTEENQEIKPGKAEYESVEALKELLKILDGKKFKLDCGHRVTFGCFLGNDIVIINGKSPEILCSQCAR